MLKTYAWVCLLLTLTTVSYAQDKPELHVGGALRFNYNLSTWKDAQKKRGGDFGYDVFRINAKAKYKGVKLNAEYRLYSPGFGGGMLKQGWFGYDFNDKNNLQLGLTQVPFGITQYNSHTWFFSINYYVGLEDDHDMGVKYTHIGEQWEYALAFFKNAEELRFGNNSDIDDGRYSYDIASKDWDGDGELDLRNKEINQVNGKLSYKFGSETRKNKLGISAEYGGVYNLDTESISPRYAFAIHYELTAGPLNLKAQISTYKITTDGLIGEPTDIIAMTAYGYPYFVAAAATSYTLGISYDIPVSWGPVSNLQLYNDFGFLDKTVTRFEDTFMNVTGVLVTAGNIYSYFDFAAGKNQPWLNPDFDHSLAEGSSVTNQWEARFNINFGYYF
ncbi:hypothetical protein SAMN04488028_10967 [Reichenbachiella agariperforans]|uniref:Phosphate-selective porin O and P n=1 Tax=Reichenbachiella agariperforans TaxID=156994 RepID=A0A1M6VJ14_REIAG|nr:hypothetical protein [Reichenbachiella agariperforans]SHK81354.1 hypothetical protein SAMN04488028_10967 [Reichenbachiella agariperforans]